MQRLKKLLLLLKDSCRDNSFLIAIEQVEGIVSKILSLVMIAVILVAMFDLIIVLSKQLLVEPVGFFNESLFEVFGLFLNVLIALEILENITAYLRKHVVQVELVIVTSLIAVARKIIILNLEKTGGIEIIGLALAILSLSISYWIIRRTAPRNNH
ncbi:MAG: phosphate-starvation-inducible PsiE family protein [Coleofasciculus sp. G3-WIS-01]|uniref:phosphate-starvation-inducible PsiE family protein n=1 Tax=Coleofasciculus sp. G3-WIS-01 TaxID=3069528 RepID=UPI00330475B9